MDSDLRGGRTTPDPARHTEPPHPYFARPPGHAPKGALTRVAGAIAVAATCTAHAVMAARGEWGTNEKGLLHRAGLQRVDDVTAGMRATPESLVTAVTDTEALPEAAPR